MIESFIYLVSVLKVLLSYIITSAGWYFVFFVFFIPVNILLLAITYVYESWELSNRNRYIESHNFVFSLGFFVF